MKFTITSLDGFNQGLDEFMDAIHRNQKRQGLLIEWNLSGKMCFSSCQVTLHPERSSKWQQSGFEKCNHAEAAPCNKLFACRISLNGLWVFVFYRWSQNTPQSVCMVKITRPALWCIVHQQFAPWSNLFVIVFQMTILMLLIVEHQAQSLCLGRHSI